jgi:cytochrome c oxidase cbb3-type subunit I/II
MPSYAWLERQDLDFASLQKKVDAMAMLGVPYGDAVLHAEQMAHTQSREIAERIASQGGPKHLENKQIVALVAYLQRLGTDIKHQGS